MGIGQSGIVRDAYPLSLGILWDAGDHIGCAQTVGIRIDGIFLTFPRLDPFL